jgi:tetratricopeptide (TPR) repeat protein
LKPNSAPAYFNRGNAFRELRQHEAATADYDQATTIKPGYAEAFAIALSPPNAKLYHRLAFILLDDGRFAEAEFACWQAIALQPDWRMRYSTLNFLLDHATTD